jgi:hypothetical protein
MNYNPPDDVYLFIVHLALQRYSLCIDDFYKLTEWHQIFKHPNIIRSAYIALDFWNTEKFIGLDYKKQNDARLILLALQNI